MPKAIFDHQWPAAYSFKLLVKAPLLLNLSSVRHGVLSPSLFAGVQKVNCLVVGIVGTLKGVEEVGVVHKCRKCAGGW